LGDQECKETPSVPEDHHQWQKAKPPHLKNEKRITK
jgi:hypothetical protein